LEQAVITTTDQPATSLEDRPTEYTERSHPDHPVRSARTRPSRKTLAWSVVGFIALTATPAAMMLESDSTDTSVNGAVATRVTPVANPPTELDIRGIPTWWSGAPAATQGKDVTELDIRGIPTWWSGAPAAGQGKDVTELDIRGIPTWWSGAPAAGRH
jgi:hypothetical protein